VTALSQSKLAVSKSALTTAGENKMSEILKMVKTYYPDGIVDIGELTRARNNGFVSIIKAIRELKPLGITFEIKTRVHHSCAGVRLKSICEEAGIEFPVNSRKRTYAEKVFDHIRVLRKETKIEE
jgi:hypothetical protein